MQDLTTGISVSQYLWSSIPNDLQVTFATSSSYTLIATIHNKLIFLCSFVIVVLCQQKYSQSSTQEVSITEVSTGRRKDQRWWPQGKLKRKVFLWFLTWPKDRMDAERHYSAMQLVSGREAPWEVLGPALFLLIAKPQASWHNQLPHLHRSSTFLNLLNPGFPGNGCVAWHLQLRMCPWAPAACRAELAMKNECSWGNNTLCWVALKTTKVWKFSKPCHRRRWQTLVLWWTEHRHYVCELKPFWSSFLICVTPG